MDELEVEGMELESTERTSEALSEFPPGDRVAAKSLWVG